MTAVSHPQEQRVLLRNVRWDTYEDLICSHENSGAPRFTYDRGKLEIMSPLPIHERSRQFIDLLLTVLADERGVDLYGLGSATFRREDLQVGFEGDCCFYIRNAARVRGKDRIDLAMDPPPDLIAEIDITHPTIDKLSIYGEVGIPEVWRYDGEQVHVLVLEEGRYVPQPRSRSLPDVTAEDLAQLLGAAVWESNAEWLRRARAWVRSLPH